MAGFTSVWVFVGEGASLPSGVFASSEAAALWIARHGLTGLLTEYPLGEGAYDWAVAQQTFVPRRDDQRTASFIQRFSNPHLHHSHFEDGVAVA